MARKMLSFYVLQFGALLALNFQLYGLIMSYKMFAHRNNMILASFLSSRQSKLQRKRKHALARQLRRKARSVWFQNKLLVAVLARTVLKMRVRKLTSQPGLEKFAIIWEISARLPGLKIPARLAQGGLKFQPGLAFQPGLKTSHVIAKSVLQRVDCRGGLSFQPG